MILYHGSRQIVEYPEIRKKGIKQDFQPRDYIAACYKEGVVL
ncbi:hypothetical protein BRYFOR_05704 [Marvinbryantia formatexigens DSM 14469]|uniref:Uncharacterized protein n=1 Tax=Marvinbryantia formatexigens DSM 14469 TaxID=478749 RepID=C6LAR0_9FIRM|nr:hypothetical protein [Marvinbryantia formatexigens]EET62041.1 hypothetical protein BRYFOR_05704 [Marvinbryantia formatexigens DSM 14469]UWO26585.1 DUF3990 domain-containing protein [Marvinbryantia formatexigens DSM 14469]SDH13028.1 hypothetical protein SAMN05660368_03888 [Marvinbryantia formatexigens]